MTRFQNYIKKILIKKLMADPRCWDNGVQKVSVNSYVRNVQTDYPEEVLDYDSGIMNILDDFETYLYETYNLTEKE